MHSLVTVLTLMASLAICVRLLTYTGQSMRVTGVARAGARGC